MQSRIKNVRIGFVLIFVLLAAANVGLAQTKNKTVALPNAVSKPESAKATPAFAEILLRKTERESELEELLLSYQEEYPKVRELRFEVGTLQKYLDRLLAVGDAQSGKLTLALGKLIIRKVELETDLWNLRQQNQEDKPEVKRAKRKVEVYERAIKEIL